MLSKKFRLKREEIEGLKRERKNKILQGKFFGLIYQEGEGKKFALILSNKLCHKATERNRIKRLFYRAIERKPFNKEGKFLFLAKRGSLESNLADFEKELTFLSSKLP